MKIKLIFPGLAAVLFFCVHLTSAQEAAPGSQPTPYLTPEEELKKFVLPEGYHLELVLSDPIIKEPVVAMFDGNGRMYVAEMRSYMQDIDGHNEMAHVGRVSMHWSSKHNGVYDRHTVFADNLLLPRMLLPLQDGVLVNETDSNDVWLYRDTNGDGVADQKVLVLPGGPRGGNLEHQQSGMVWGRDNWIYQAVNSFRFRMEGTNTLVEPTGPNGGQWGINQDDYGKMWFVNAGSEIGPLNFQQPIVYGAFSVPDQFGPEFSEVWPLVGLADVEGGVNRFRPSDKTLNHFTATCGDEIYRGDRLPADLRGDLLFGEPVGRLIRRAKVSDIGGVTYLHNAYEKGEFIRSTDPNFRPVNMMTAPDGTLYIVDMYRGVIQEGNWVRPGSYLRPMVQKYQLDKNTGRGRIWRLVHDGFKPGPEPKMLDETPAQLVKHLTHPNGWWRDTAQKLLVLRGDKSVVPSLVKMTETNPNRLARLGALWTLEGLHALSPALVFEKLTDKDPRVRAAAIRTSETLFKGGDASVVGPVEAMAHDSDPEVVIQAMMTAHLLKWTNWSQLIDTAIAGNSARGVSEIGFQMLQPGRATRSEFTGQQAALFNRGKAIYQELCFACHGPDGRGMPMQGAPRGTTLAPPLGGSQTATGYHDGIIAVVLKGLTGPVNDRIYSAQMVPMESNGDEWVAAVTSFVRNSFGNHASFITPQEVARMREKVRARTGPWTLAELREALPEALKDRAQWKVTASHHPQSAGLAIDGNLETRYDTGTPQTPGMWYQVELPEEEAITGLELDAGTSRQDYPRGYSIDFSGDGVSWTKGAVTGRGTTALTEIGFAPVKTKYIRINQTGMAPGLFWSIHELQVLGAPRVKMEQAAANPAPKPAGTKFE
jgi:mono/diheme cytochrome c family protein/glucose/arabinose dehydrogenase